MAKMSPQVADAELKILQALWQRQPAGAREITETVYGATSTSQVATIQKLLTRLEAKHLVRRDRSSHVHTFTTSVTRETFAGLHLEQMADKLTEGSLIPFITHLVQAKRISKQEREQIRRLLEDGTSKKPGEHR